LFELGQILSEMIFLSQFESILQEEEQSNFFENVDSKETMKKIFESENYVYLTGKKSAYLSKLWF